MKLGSFVLLAAVLAIGSAFHFPPRALPTGSNFPFLPHPAAAPTPDPMTTCCKKTCDTDDTSSPCVSNCLAGNFQQCPYSNKTSCCQARCAPSTYYTYCMNYCTVQDGYIECARPPLMTCCYGVCASVECQNNCLAYKNDQCTMYPPLS